MKDAYIIFYRYYTSFSFIYLSTNFIPIIWISGFKSTRWMCLYICFMKFLCLAFFNWRCTCKVQRGAFVVSSDPTHAVSWYRCIASLLMCVCVCAYMCVCVSVLLCPLYMRIGSLCICCLPNRLASIYLYRAVILNPSQLFLFAFFFPVHFAGNLWNISEKNFLREFLRKECREYTNKILYILTLNSLLCLWNILRKTLLVDILNFETTKKIDFLMLENFNIRRQFLKIISKEENFTLKINIWNIFAIHFFFSMNADFDSPIFGILMKCSSQMHFNRSENVNESKSL